MKNKLVDKFEGTEISKMERMSPQRLRKDIAVIGMSCRLPGANSVSEFWEILKNGLDQVGPTPRNRFNLIPGLVEIQGGFIKNSLDEFDAPFFNVSAKEAPFMDPQQRLFLEVAIEGLESARIPASSLRHTKTGIFCGVAFSQYRNFVEPVVNADNSALYYEVMGCGWSGIPGRLAHYLDVNGPNIVAEAGCASSAVSLYQAVQSLRLGESNLAIVGGVNLMLDKSIRIPPVIITDRCRTFDASAKGFAPAEGITVVILKVLEDAVRDSDQILGIIRGTATNHNGTTRSLGSPCAQAQTELILSAMADAQVTPNEITYFEAHGTGTKAGDPSEAAGICGVFESNNRPLSQPLFISSTKTYLGHTLSASCLAGLIRILLSMRHGSIPKHLHLANLHPKIDFQRIPGQIPLDNCAWKPRDGETVLIAGLNSFGMAGTNVHFVVESGRSPGLQAIQSTNGSRGSHLFPISAKDPSALSKLLQLYSSQLRKEQKVDLGNFAYSLSTTRSHYSHRLGIVAKDETELLYKLANGVSRERVVMSDAPEPLVFLFTGYGAGTLENCREFYDTSPIFRATFNNASETLTGILGTTLEEVLWDPKFTHARDPVYAQPALFCVQYCFWKLWLSFLGERLADHQLIVLGHSFGEYAAAVAAGYISFYDGLKLVCCRAKLLSEFPQESGMGSGMLAIRSSLSEVGAYVQQFLNGTELQSPWIDIATVNSPKQTVVSAPSDVLEEFEKYIKTQVEVPRKRLDTSHGFHSRAMDPILEKYRETLDTIVFHPKQPNVTYISALLGQEVNGDGVANSSYWTRHLREPVQFSGALRSIFEGYPESKVFIEIGPNSVLLKLVKDNGGEGTVMCPSMQSLEPSAWLTLNKSLRELYENWNGELCWESIYEDYACTKIELPHYPFQRIKYWIGQQSAPQWTEELSLASTGGISHPLLGAKLDLATPSLITYTSHISVGSEVYWKNLTIAGNHILSTTSCIEAILNLRPSPVHLTNIKMTKGLRLDMVPVRIQTTLKKVGSSRGEFAMFSKRKDDNEWTEIFSTSISPERFSCSEGELEVAPILSGNLGSSTAAIYEQMAALGLEYTPSFQLIESVRVLDNESTGSVFQTVPLTWTSPRHACNPLLLDTMLQSYLLFTTSKNPSKIMRLPVDIGQFSWYGSEGITREPSPYFIHISESDERMKLMDIGGQILGTMSGVVLRETTKEEFSTSLGTSSTSTQPTENNWIRSPELIVEKFQEMGEWKDLHSNLNVNEMDRIPERRLRYDSLCYKYILRLLVVDGGWRPKLRESITPSDLESLFSTYQHGVNANCFRRFIQILTEEGFLSYNENVKYWTVAKELSNTEMVELENCEFFKRVLHPSDYAELEAQLTRHFGEGLPRVFRNQITPLQHLFNSHPNLHMGMFYGEIPEAVRINQKLADTLEQEVFSRCPTGMTIQVLEIGAGTGATTAQILRRLDAAGVRYKYTFTDIGPSFLVSAKTKFSSNADKMCFELLNIEKDPCTQGFVPGAYHVIIGANVIHATKNLSVTLRHTRTLLAPSGFFGLIEVFRTERFTDLTAAMLDGWWLFEDERVGNLGPLMPSEAWTRTLEQNGFRNPVTIGPDSWSYGSIICRADPLYKLPLHETQRNWIICNSEGNEKLTEALAHQLIARDPASNVILGLKQGVNSDTEKRNGQLIMDIGTPIDFSLLRNWIRNNRCKIDAFIYVWTGGQDEKEFCEALRMFGGLDPREMPNRVVLVAKGIIHVQELLEETAKPFQVSKHQELLNIFGVENDNVRTLGIDLDVTSGIEESATQTYHLLYGSQVKNQHVVMEFGNAYVPNPDNRGPKELTQSKRNRHVEPVSQIQSLDTLAQQVLDSSLNRTQKTATLEQILEICLRIHAELPDCEGALNPNLSLAVYGMDSLMAMEIQMRISKLLGIELSPDMFLQQKTIRGLANAVSGLLST